ncbi:Dihydrodipicolinate reductase [Spirochaeta thermophila DSM 6578]|uniref:4-hydroxy-tetrahydrodipicolinate reductase n=1 Tax=Winmispira thermophila (strain ATCC 700085 / DSM 6578 / Z-1203) TaxID=869211 RepID=G0GFF5_WINT7|nr:4-hydroxy-tetrahydrodipicolinate reductase [Spirochaeta thermophila]AEJ61569.1 Dihydrodipicolinate reductase [Spirochaeta thermophila DSM 6578]
MKVVLVGYGRMGREVEQVLRERGHEVTYRVDPSGSGDAPTLTPSLLSGADMAIEFSHASSVVANCGIYVETGVPAVVGTTGWTDRIEEVRRMVGEKIGYLWGANFSIGAHLFFALAVHATRLTHAFPEYDALAYEIHHRRKKDSPSGTALTLAQKIIEASKTKKRVVIDRLSRAPEPDELHVASVRGGEVPGTHTFMLDSEADTVEITHRARSRRGFAVGAVRAAEWLLGRKGFFTVETFIDDIFGEVANV